MSGLDEMLPCPFCGGNKVRVINPASDNGNIYVLCEGCNSGGTPRATKAEAIAAWNRRAPLSAVGQKAGTVEVKADGDLLDQAVAFAEMWGTEQNWPHVRDAYMAAILRERAKLSLRSPSGKTIPNYPEYDNARSR